MTRLATKGAAVAMVSGLALAPAAAIASPSDAYSHHHNQPKARHYVRQPAVVGENFTRSTLPFTGGDIAAMSLIGVATLGAGTAFVVVGRRRRSQPA